MFTKHRLKCFLSWQIEEGVLKELPDEKVSVKKNKRMVLFNLFYFLFYLNKTKPKQHVVTKSSPAR